jgi:energy-coupling factor transporter ATP-binding protein EcfA2
MAKALLSEYKIGGDVIDRVVAPSSTPEAAPEAEPLPFAPLPPHSAGSDAQEQGDSPESKATGGTSKAAATTTGELGCERDGLFHQFRIGEMSYRVGGVRQLFVTSLKVNIRASSGGASYYDSLDLYAAKARTGYAQALARSFGVELARAEKDLVLILEYLERERDEALRRGNEKEPVAVSAADRELGLSLLRDPRLFERIAEDLSALGYVGEDLNKELVYLCASSRRLDDPISVLILSQSAAGKSYLVEMVRRLMPPEEVVAVTSLSDQALNYIDDLSHKFLILGEAVHGEVVEHQIREMLSGKELSRLVTVKDPETGKMQSRVVRTPVIVSSVMSGTSHALNPENVSRYFVVNADESREQTLRIHEAQRQRYSVERLRQGHEAAELIVRTHQAAQRLLVKKPIVNDFAPLLGFPTSLMRSRRDHDRFLDLIACVCYLRQYQKREEHEGSLSFIRCDLEDYAVAYRIMVDGVLSSTVRELPAGAVGLYSELRTWVGREAERQGLRAEEVSFTQRQVREFTALGHTWIKQALRQLVEYEYLSIARGGSERTRAFYRIREDAAIAEMDLSMIPSPEAMAEKIKLGKLVKSGH